MTRQRTNDSQKLINEERKKCHTVNYRGIQWATLYVTLGSHNWMPKYWHDQGNPRDGHTDSLHWYFPRCHDLRLEFMLLPSVFLIKEIKVFIVIPVDLNRFVLATASSHWALCDEKRSFLIRSFHLSSISQIKPSPASHT